MVWSILPLFSACLFPELTIFTMVNTLQTHNKKTPAKTTHIKATIISLLNQTTTDKKKKRRRLWRRSRGYPVFFRTQQTLNHCVCGRKNLTSFCLRGFSPDIGFSNGGREEKPQFRNCTFVKGAGDLFSGIHTWKKKQGRILLCTFRWSLFWMGMDFWWPQELKKMSLGGSTIETFTRRLEDPLQPGWNDILWGQDKLLKYIETWNVFGSSQSPRKLSPDFESHRDFKRFMVFVSSSCLILVLKVHAF